MITRALAILMGSFVAVQIAPASLIAQEEKATMAVETTQAVASTTGHVEVNGVSYYYEIHGRGEPLLLLHGGLGSIDMFGPNLPLLAEGRQVIAVDLHGHGRTALGDRNID